MGRTGGGRTSPGGIRGAGLPVRPDSARRTRGGQRRTTARPGGLARAGPYAAPRGRSRRPGPLGGPRGADPPHTPAQVPCATRPGRPHRRRQAGTPGYEGHQARARPRGPGSQLGRPSPRTCPGRLAGSPASPPPRSPTSGGCSGSWRGCASPVTPQTGRSSRRGFAASPRRCSGLGAASWDPSVSRCPRGGSRRRAMSSPGSSAPGPARSHPACRGLGSPASPGRRWGAPRPAESSSG